MKNIAELNSFTAFLGNNPMYVQGAGGNCSIKLDNELVIKSSGSKMSDALNKNIFIKIPNKILNSAISKLNQDINIFDKIFLDMPIRPSIETGLHALMPHKYVFHLHEINVLSIAVTYEAKSIFLNKLQGLNWKYINYCKPGSELIYNINKKCKNEKFDILILENHGIVIGGESILQISNLLEDVIKRINIEPSANHKFNNQKLDFFAEKLKLRKPKYEESNSIAMSESKIRISTNGSLYPDHIVFLGKSAELFNIKNNQVKLSNSYLKILPGVGVLLDPKAKSGAEEMLLCLSLVLSRIQSKSTIKYLTKIQENQISNWEAEKYRIRLDK